MKLIFGLGNPGKEHANTRHNLGWMVVSNFAQKEGWNFRKDAAFKANIADGKLGNEKVLLIQPLTYMNLSGECVLAVSRFYKAQTSDILIIQDELDLPFGRVAFLGQGGAAGHNGIRSIHSLLGTQHVARLRLGIGQPPAPQAKEDFVLESFSREQSAELGAIIEKASEAAKTWAEQGLAKAMNLWNGVE